VGVMAAARHDQYQIFFAGPLVFLIGCELVLATFSSLSGAPELIAWKAGGTINAKYFFAGRLVSATFCQV